MSFDLLCNSDRRSRGEESREENIIFGLESSVTSVVGVLLWVALVGGLRLIAGVGCSRREE